jgi:hypothetical protein
MSGSCFVRGPAAPGVDVGRGGSAARGSCCGPARVRTSPSCWGTARGLVAEPVRSWVRELVTNDQSLRTVRAYCHALLTWYQVLWLVGTQWEQATELETAALVGWMRTARNPQRCRPDAAAAGTVNIKTGKPLLGPGYRPATINLALAAVHAWGALDRVVQNDDRLLRRLSSRRTPPPIPSPRRAARRLRRRCARSR